MKKITKIAAAGLAAIISSCAPAEIKQKPFEYKMEPGITRTDYFDGSFEIKREEPKLVFRHNETSNYNFVDFYNEQGHFLITDYKCDGVADQLNIDNGTGVPEIYFRYQFGKEKIFEKADRMLANVKQELGF
jgi:hypothetical protein